MKLTLPIAMTALSLAVNGANAATHTISRADVTGITVISVTGNGAKLRRGDNPLDDAIPFTCNGAGGCLVTIQTMAGLTISDSFVRICSTVDGVDALPECPAELKEIPVWSMAANSLQSATVASGDHLLQTTLKVNKSSKDAVVPKVRGWQIVYTIYEQ